MYAARITDEPSINYPASPVLSILLVEDSAVTQDLLRFYLTNAGHEVEVASDGDSALEKLLNQRFDIAIVDFHLPNKDGLQVVVDYKNEKSNKETPKFIGITADIAGLLAHPQNCENFDKVLRKPFDPNLLCRELEYFDSPGYRKGVLPSRDLMFVDDLEISIKPRDNVYRFPTVQRLESAQGDGLQEQPADDSIISRPRFDRKASDGDSLFDRTTIIMADGSRDICQIRSISCGGASISLEARPKVGEKVKIGKTTAWVETHTSDGISVLFREKQ